MTFGHQAIRPSKLEEFLDKCCREHMISWDEAMISWLLTVPGIHRHGKIFNLALRIQ